jgi:hypothetical protein
MVGNTKIGSNFALFHLLSKGAFLSKNILAGPSGVKDLNLTRVECVF